MDYMIYTKVDKLALVSKLEENKARYVNSIDALKAAWVEKNESYKVKHDEWFKKYIAQKLEDDEHEPQRPKKLVNRTDDYNLYIEMYNNSLEETVDLSVEDFSMLWRDNWNWMRMHTQNIRAYACSDMAFSVGTTSSLNSAMMAYNISL